MHFSFTRDNLNCFRTKLTMVGQHDICAKTQIQKWCFERLLLGVVIRKKLSEYKFYKKMTMNHVRSAAN